MENPPTQEDTQEQEEKYFETYEIKQSDLEVLQQGIDTAVESGLFEQETFDDIRIVIFDATHFYVFTRGQHATNEHFNVEEIPSSSKTGFKIFKIAHSGDLESLGGWYKGAMSSFESDEIETTAVNARKFPNLCFIWGKKSHRKEKLNVIQMPPEEPYTKIQQGLAFVRRFNYLTDCLFHEIGHEENYALERWQAEEKTVVNFPSAEQEEKFISVVRQTKLFPKWVVDLILSNFHKGNIMGMYAILIDHEAARRYDLQVFDNENMDFQRRFAGIRSESPDQETIHFFAKCLSETHHGKGVVLVRILEEQFPDFHERKRFVRSVLEHRKT